MLLTSTIPALFSLILARECFFEPELFVHQNLNACFNEKPLFSAAAQRLYTHRLLDLVWDCQITAIWFALLAD